MTEWKCTNCGNREISETKPSICTIECCGRRNTFERFSVPTATLNAKWKCTNCGNRSYDILMPDICPITCCNETKTYVPIPMNG